MAIKIDAHMSAVAHHIIDGPVTFPYAVDAISAVSRFPGEWSHKPWSAAKTNEALRESGKPEVEITADEQAAIDAHAQAVADANERLRAFHEKKAAERAEADQVARDEELVKSPAPRPDPAIKRPFGRKGDPTPSELKLIEKRDSGKKAEEAKAEEDRLGRSGATITS